MLFAETVDVTSASSLDLQWPWPRGHCLAMPWPLLPGAGKSLILLPLSAPCLCASMLLYFFYLLFLGFLMII